MNEKLKLFEIKLEDIENVDFENGMIQKIARKYSDEYDLKRLELVLNENIITAKDKFTGIHSYMGMKVSLEPLEKNISFIVRPTSEPTYAELQQENEQLKEQIRIMKEHPFISKFYEFGRSYGKTLITNLEQRIDKTSKYLCQLLQEAYLEESSNIDIGLIEYAVDLLKGENNE